MANKTSKNSTASPKTKQQIIIESLQALYLKDNNSSMNKLAKKISIVNTVEKNIEFAVVEAYYETRKIYNVRKISNYIKTSATKKMDASSYDKWTLKMPTYKNAFAEEKSTYALEASKFIEKCERCNAVKVHKCSACTNGREICDVCSGTGAYDCNNCYGLGVETCYICHGIGYTERTEYVNGGGTRIVKEWCSCRNGQVSCNYCGGSGRLVCGSCGGNGEVLCSTCNGKMLEACKNCYQYGYFINQVEVEQNFSSAKRYIIIEGYNLDPNKYGEQKFEYLKVYANDVCTYESISDTAIDKTPHANLSNSNAFLANKVIENGGKSILKYRAREFRREIVEVEYTINGHLFNSMIDLSSGQVITDKNPYEVFKIKVKAPKPVKEKNNKPSKKKSKVKADVVVTWIIGIICICPWNVTFIYELIKERAWIAIVICLVSVIIPIVMLYKFWEDLDQGFRKVLGFIKMLFAVGIVSLIINILVRILYYYLQTHTNLF